MKKQILVSSLVLSQIFASPVAFAADGDKETAGGIIGAIVGGLLGNQVGQGDGRTVATIIGVIAGAAIGSSIGRDLDRGDKLALEKAQRDALRGDLNRSYDWDGAQQGSRTGARGNFVSTREGRYRNNRDLLCREYRSVIIQGGRREENTGVACSYPDGTWREVKTNEVSWNGEVVSSTTTTREGNGGPYRPAPVPQRPEPRPRDRDQSGCQYSDRYVNRAYSVLRENGYSSSEKFAAADYVQNSCAYSVFSSLANNDYSNNELFRRASQVDNENQARAMKCLIQNGYTRLSIFAYASRVQTRCSAEQVCYLAEQGYTSDRNFAVAASSCR